MLCRTCWLPTKLWHAMRVWKSTFWSHIRIFFSQKISAKSVTNSERFHQGIMTMENGTKASGPQVCWQTIAGQWRRLYLTANTGENHSPVHFRGKFLPVSWARKVLFCTFNSSVPFKPCLIEKFCIHIWMQHKSTAKFIYWSSWDKKKINFCWPV